MPREVFELNDDERWQARLEEARARREVALREKAEKPARKRLKPWEQDGAFPEKSIDPVVQDREDDDRVDFADRVETIRAAARTEEASKAKGSPVGHNSSVKAAQPYVIETSSPPSERTPPTETSPKPAAHKPPAPDEFDQILTSLPAAKPHVRELQLVLPDAPPVEEIASRYAATLRAEPEGNLGASPAEATPPPAEHIATQEDASRDQRRHRRPILLIMGISLLALNAIANEVPPLKVGPPMPPVSSFVFEPALGVTWSLQAFPRATSSGEWAPRVNVAPVAPPVVEGRAPIDYALSATAPLAPLVENLVQLEAWVPTSPVSLGQSTRLFEPSVAGGINPGFSADPNSPVPSTTETAQQSLPKFGNVPAKPRPPSIRAASPDAAPDDAGLTTPPEAPPLSPLKITILSPTRSNQKIAAAIAADLPRRGHGEVRLREVGYSIKKRNIRFYFDEDRAEAARLAKIYGAELRDFTWYRPKPSSGTTELWLPGSGTRPKPVRTPRRTRALEPPAPQLVFPPVVIEQVPRRRSFLERLFDGGNQRSASSSDSNDNRFRSNDDGQSVSSGTSSQGADTVDTITDTETDDTVATDTSDTDDSSIDTGTGGAVTGTDTGSTDADTGGAGTDTAGTDTVGTGTVDDTDSTEISSDDTESGSTDTGTTDTGADDSGSTGTDSAGSDSSDTDGSDSGASGTGTDG